MLELLPIPIVSLTLCVGCWVWETTYCHIYCCM